MRLKKGSHSILTITYISSFCLILNVKHAWLKKHEKLLLVSIAFFIIIFNSKAYAVTHEEINIQNKEKVPIPLQNQNTWINMSEFSTITPIFRLGHSMSYDSSNDRIIMFGGMNWNTLNDTWTYDYKNTTWQDRHPFLSPPASWMQGLVYNSRHDRTILFGGMLEDGITLSNYMWSYSSKTNVWTNLSSSIAPTPRYSHAMAYDSQSDRVIIFGGGTESETYGTDETWSFDFGNNTWMDMTSTIRPPPRIQHQISYDPIHDRVILFGGRGPVNHKMVSLDDTWTYDYDTNTWKNMSPLMIPTGLSQFAMAYDSQSQAVILFGGISSGNNGNIIMNDTWSYNYEKNLWEKLIPLKSPSPCSSCAMAYNSRFDKMILFGGFIKHLPPGKYSNETWVYAWDYTPGTSPGNDHPSDNSVLIGIIQFLILPTAIIVILIMGIVYVFLRKKKKSTETRTPSNTILHERK